MGAAEGKLAEQDRATGGTATRLQRAAADAISAVFGKEDSGIWVSPVVFWLEWCAWDFGLRVIESGWLCDVTENECGVTQDNRRLGL